MKGVKKRNLFLVIVACSYLLPLDARADVAGVAFTTDPRTTQPSVASQIITIQTQDTSGSSANVAQTTCVALQSSSASGQFSSNATSWNAISVLSMSKGTANKSFYYKDSSIGTPSIIVTVAPRPDTESRTCTSWPIAEWGAVRTATQTIVVSDASVAVADTSTNTSQTGTTTPSSSSSATAAATQQSASSYVPPPAPVLFADAGDDRTVIVGADVQFDARAYDRSQQSVDTVRFLWNFGDGVTAEGESVLHHFSYPDRYAVILSIAHDKFAATDEFVVDAQPAALSFFLLPDGGVAIGNESGRELDLSGWIIRQSADLFAPQFILPPRTKVLAGSSLRISVDTLHFRATDQTMLEYPNGTRAYSMNANSSALERGSVVTSARVPVSAIVPQISVSRAHTAAVATPVASRRADVSSSMTDVSETQESDPAVATSTDADSSGNGSYSGQQAAAAALFDTSDAGWLAAAIAISLSAGGAVAVASRLKKREWTVIDEGGE